ncbi:hypothetical protein EVAR_79224_1 [Eumeta japonica]|uniref:Uncharacterized protein n=1 Tax=Eumeta variegata TaxID=151549 RepID=A0A4C1Z9V9_EUMVA|nr:hypothetical protein EVAR_79224_1 [Eumeta japonica]
MSNLHTLVPSVETSQMTSQRTLTASPSAAGRHMRVPTARDMRYGRRLEGVARHRMSQETVTGRFSSLLPGRRRLAAAGWGKGA